VWCHRRDPNLVRAAPPLHPDIIFGRDRVSRKICDIPAFDATRAWRAWQAEQDQIEKLERAEREFGLQRKLLHGLSKARLYGGAALVIGIEGQDMGTELAFITRDAHAPGVSGGRAATTSHPTI
jgi:hypothetical protein